ncbi:MAG: hypothetical protein NTZ59_12735 [Bacteroidetes bacterium]|nr:hypothetical protein [Bacteroidota bacterium]
MKRIIFFITLISIVCFSCKSYVELYKTESTNTKAQDKTYLYENDTIKVEYSFWAEKGIMAFSVFNKLDKPLYIDWKKSNYISNSKKFDYWADKETSTRNTTNYEYYNKSLLSIPFLTNYLNSSVSSSISVKPERITFIPPKAIIFKSDYFITNSNYNNWEKDFQSILVKDINPNLKKNLDQKSIAKSKKFTKENSPLTFRNFFTFSTKENFETEFYIDNNFFINEIMLFNRKDFGEVTIDKKNRVIDIFYFEDGKSFHKELKEN